MDVGGRVGQRRARACREADAQRFWGAKRPFCLTQGQSDFLFPTWISNTSQAGLEREKENEIFVVVSAEEAAFLLCQRGLSLRRSLSPVPSESRPECNGHSAAGHSSHWVKGGFLSPAFFYKANAPSGSAI